MFPRIAPAIIPSPLPKWSKWAISLGALPHSFIVNLLDFLGSTTGSDDPNPGTWMHVQCVWTDASSGLKADEMVVTLDIANVTNGGLDSTWTEDDFVSVSSRLDSWLADWSAIAATGVNGKEIRFYARSFNPYSNIKPFVLSGPPAYVFPSVQLGQGTNPMPHQVAVSTTELTTYPRHWGRMYMPGPAAGPTNVGAGGRLTQVLVDSWAQATEAAYSDLADLEFFPCVPTTQVNKAPQRLLLGVTGIQVDNVADVIRRRRAFSTTYRKVLPVQ